MTTFFVSTQLKIFFFQTSTQSPLGDTSSKTIIVELLNVVLTVTEKLVENAKTVNSLLEANQESIIADAETFLAEIGTQVNNIVLKLIDQLKEEATEDGISVLECIDGQEETTNIALAETITLTATCLSETSPALLVVANDILEHVQSVEAKVKAQVETLEACTETDLQCLIAFGSTALELGNEISEIVSQDLDSVVAVIQEGINHVASCKLLDNVKSNTQKIFDNVVVCIKS